MSHPEVQGVVILARNGDRTECYQHPITQKPGYTQSTPLGEVRLPALRGACGAHPVALCPVGSGASARDVPPQLVP